jgi:hypothetical protein
MEPTVPQLDIYTLHAAPVSSDERLQSCAGTTRWIAACGPSASASPTRRSSYPDALRAQRIDRGRSCTANAHGNCSQRHGQCRVHRAFARSAARQQSTDDSDLALVNAVLAHFRRRSPLSTRSSPPLLGADPRGCLPVRHAARASASTTPARFTFLMRAAGYPGPGRHRLPGRRAQSLRWHRSPCVSTMPMPGRKSGCPGSGWLRVDPTVGGRLRSASSLGSNCRAADPARKLSQR